MPESSPKQREGKYQHLHMFCGYGYHIKFKTPAAKRLNESLILFLVCITGIWFALQFRENFHPLHSKNKVQ